MAAWLREWIWVPFVGLVGTYLVLLFPDGRLPSSRWRVVAGLAVVALVFSSLSKAFFPGRLEETPGIAIANPFGIEAAREVLELLGTIGDALFKIESESVLKWYHAAPFLVGFVALALWGASERVKRAEVIT